MAVFPAGALEQGTMTFGSVDKTRSTDGVFESVNDASEKLWAGCDLRVNNLAGTLGSVVTFLLGNTPPSGS